MSDSCAYYQISLLLPCCHLNVSFLLQLFDFELSADAMRQLFELNKDFRTNKEEM